MSEVSLPTNLDDMMIPNDNDTDMNSDVEIEATWHALATKG